ncbi:hypothetical protein EJB05_52925, partial [Eragrostis curvula]
MAVQRQTAASRSTRPPSSEQHGSLWGRPTLTRPSTLAHTFSFSASIGHFPCPWLDGVGTTGGCGLGTTGPGQLYPQPCAAAVKTRLRARNRANLGAIADPRAGSKQLVALTTEQLQLDL